MILITIGQRPLLIRKRDDHIRSKQIGGFKLVIRNFKSRIKIGGKRVDWYTISGDQIILESILYNLQNSQ